MWVPVYSLKKKEVNDATWSQCDHRIRVNIFELLWLPCKTLLLSMKLWFKVEYTKVEWRSTQKNCSQSVYWQEDDCNFSLLRESSLWRPFLSTSSSSFENLNFSNTTKSLIIKTSSSWSSSFDKTDRFS